MDKTDIHGAPMGMDAECREIGVDDVQDLFLSSLKKALYSAFQDESG
jgi:hypothetical protein